jgi:hypothetical protein
MRNVYKGYQASKSAMPKTSVAAINKSYSMYHSGRIHMPTVRLNYGIKMPKKAPRMPGRNPGTRM